MNNTVFLGCGRNEPCQSCRLADTDGQDPGCHRIERAKVTDLSCGEPLTYALDDVMGGDTSGFIDNGQTAQRWKTLQDGEVGVGEGMSRSAMCFICVRILDTI